MQVKIPRELLPYVRMSPSGLVHNDSLPKELEPLFEETRKKLDSWKHTAVGNQPLC